MVVHACNPCSWNAEAELGVLGQLWKQQDPVLAERGIGGI